MGAKGDEHFPCGVRLPLRSALPDVGAIYQLRPVRAFLQRAGRLHLRLEKGTYGMDNRCFFRAAGFGLGRVEQGI